MRNRVGIIVLPVLLSLALSCGAEPAKEPLYSSEKPVYLKVALDQAGSKAMLVVFDESKGTGKGYDVLYADTDLTRKFDKNEKVSARSHNCLTVVDQKGTLLARFTFDESKWTAKQRDELYANINADIKVNGAPGVRCDFPAVKVNVRSSNGPANSPDSCDVIFNYEKHTYPTKTTESFWATATIRLQEGSAQWEYSCRGTVKPSEKLASALVWNFLHSPKMKITAKADNRRRGNLGIGLELLSGDINVEGKKAGIPLKARIEIKKPNGGVAHKTDGDLSKFGFG